jgi:hypothetical protein
MLATNIGQAQGFQESSNYRSVLMEREGFRQSGARSRPQLRL